MKVNMSHTIKPWLEGLAQGFIECKPSPEPYKAVLVRLGFYGPAAGARRLGAGLCTSLFVDRNTSDLDSKFSDASHSDLSSESDGSDGSDHGAEEVQGDSTNSNKQLGDNAESHELDNEEEMNDTPLAKYFHPRHRWSAPKNLAPLHFST